MTPVTRAPIVATDGDRPQPNSSWLAKPICSVAYMNLWRSRGRRLPQQVLPASALRLICQSTESLPIRTIRSPGAGTPTASGLLHEPNAVSSIGIVLQQGCLLQIYWPDPAVTEK